MRRQRKERSSSCSWRHLYRGAISPNYRCHIMPRPWLTQVDASIAEFKRAVNLQPGYVTAWNNLGDAYERNKVGCPEALPKGFVPPILPGVPVLCGGAYRSVALCF